MRNFIAKSLKRKKLLIFIGLILIGGGYYGYKKYSAKNTAPQYVTAAVTKGTLVVAVSGTGQVSSSHQIDVKPLTSGEVRKILVKNGDSVEVGQILLQLNSTSAQKAVRDAEVSLQSAQLSLDKLKQPADALSIVQAANSLMSAKDSLSKLKLSQANDLAKAEQVRQSALDNISKAHEDTFTEISNTFLDLPQIIAGLDDYLLGDGLAKADRSLSSGTSNTAALLNTSHSDDRATLLPLIDKAQSDYKAARSAYDINLLHYQSVGRFSDRAVIDALLNESSATTKLLSEAAKSQITMLDIWSDLRTQRKSTDYQAVVNLVAQYRTNLTSYNSKINGHISS